MLVYNLRAQSYDIIFYNTSGCVNFFDASARVLYCAYGVINIFRNVGLRIVERWHRLCAAYLLGLRLLFL